jgi:ketosteroid isomerase-like protein
VARPSFGQPWAGSTTPITGKSHDIIADDDSATVLADVMATCVGKTLHHRVAEICHVRTGKVMERWAFSDDMAAITAFFAWRPGRDRDDRFASAATTRGGV